MAVRVRLLFGHFEAFAREVQMVGVGEPDPRRIGIGGNAFGTPSNCDFRYSS